MAPLTALTRPTLSPRASSIAKPIYDFSNFTLENLAPRANGHLLMSASNQPYLADIDPSASSIKPTYLPHLSDVTSILGIAETSNDLFAVAAGNFSSPVLAIAGSFAVWSVDMNPSIPTVKLVTAIPEAKGLNGAAALIGDRDTVLVADSVLGAVWKVNIATGKYSLAFRDSAFAPDPSKTLGTSIGINGLRTDASNLYFTNSFKGTYGRVPITADGAKAGDAVILALTNSSTTFWDDLDRDAGGKAWITLHPNSVVRVGRGGGETRFQGDGSTLVQPTSARFGKGDRARTLYVVGAGNGTVSGNVASIST